MINVDISNVWTCVTLPELLGGEKEIFDAHNLLRSGKAGGPDFGGWLGMPDAVNARLIHGVRRVAEKICAASDVLVVCGVGGAFHGARAAIDLYCGADRNLLHGPQVYFAGDSLSSRQWLELNSLLDGKDYSLHIISGDGAAIGPNVAARSLRWMMERKYGPQAKERVSVATLVGSPLHRMGQEEGYELFPMPKEAGGASSTLTAAALLPMAVAGIDPLDVLEGAAEAYRALDVRSFENPAWLYAAGRSVLSRKGLQRELLCIFDRSLTAFGQWWQRKVWQQECREGVGIFPATALIPDDLAAMDRMAAGGRSGMFETLLHFAPIAKKVPVEMDWKDYDGLGFLSGRSLDYVEAQVMTAMAETHNGGGVPILDLQAGDLTAQTLGQLFYFFELSSALTACISGVDPLEPAPAPSRACALRQMGAPSM